MYLWLTWFLLCRPGTPRDESASALYALGLKLYTTALNWVGGYCYCFDSVKIPSQPLPTMVSEEKLTVDSVHSASSLSACSIFTGLWVCSLIGAYLSAPVFEST